MTTNVGNIAVTVGANVGGFIGEMNKAGGAVGGFDKKLKTTMSSVAKYAAASAAAGVAIGVGLYQSGANLIDQQSKIARSLNSSVLGFQALAHAGDLSGVSQDAMAAASGKLNTKLGEAIRVGGAAAQELDRLGLSAKTLAGLDADERLAVISDRIVALGYDSTQASSSLKNLGIRGNEMTAMMLDGGAAIRSARQEMTDFGLAVSDIDAAQIEAANDAMSRIQTVVQGISNQLAVSLSPYLQVIAERITGASKETGGFKEAIDQSVESGLVGFGKIADVLHGVRVAFKGVELIATGFAAVSLSALQATYKAIGAVSDGVIRGINAAIDSINLLRGTEIANIDPIGNGPLMQSLDELADKARNQVGVVRSELATLAMQQLPSDQVTKYLEDVKVKAQEAAAAVVESRNRMTTMPEQNEEQAQSSSKSESVLTNLQAGTEAMRAELAKRQEIIGIYQQNQLAADAPYYAQQLNDIKIAEQVKLAELMAAHEQEIALRAQQKAEHLERAIGDRLATAEIMAQYDEQEKLAEQLKQSELTAIQEEAQAARKKLREIEKQNAISMALGLGQQLMSLAQGQSKKAFEFSKKAALASAVVDGYRSATAAWSAGMSTGGPWAPVVAAGYTAASLAKTGGLIQSIRGTGFGGGGGGSGGSAASAPVSGGGGGAGGGGAQENRVMRVENVNPNSLFTGSAIRGLVEAIDSFRGDGGGKVVFA